MFGATRTLHRAGHLAKLSSKDRKRSEPDDHAGWDTELMCWDGRDSQKDFTDLRSMSEWPDWSLSSVHANPLGFFKKPPKGLWGCFHTWFACLVQTRVRLPPLPCPPWTAFILFYLGPNRGSFQASSCLPRCLVTTAWEKAAKCIRLLSALLYIYVFELFILFSKLRNITTLMSVLRMYS